MPPVRSPFVAIALLGLLAAASFCGDEPTPGKPGASSAKPFQPQRVGTELLPNAYRLNSKVISGGLPDGELAFQQLAQLGVKTIISVDGARPDVELAKKHGLRYVHLPHGYDGIPEQRAKELAKAVRDLPGPIYLHCHHGKHRSPAAAATACVMAGMIGPQDAATLLKTAGTSENYRGLFQAVDAAKLLPPAELDALKVDFVEIVPPGPMAAAMVEIEKTHDHLKQVADAGWKAPAKHPALEPAHEALLLKEHFYELQRTEAAKKQPMAFQDSLHRSETAAAQLEADLRKTPLDPRRLAASLDSISKDCNACHQTFRDIPLREKRQP